MTKKLNYNHNLNLNKSKNQKDKSKLNIFNNFYKLRHKRIYYKSSKRILTLSKNYWKELLQLNKKSNIIFLRWYISMINHIRNLPSQIYKALSGNLKSTHNYSTISKTHSITPPHSKLLYSILSNPSNQTLNSNKLIESTNKKSKT